MAAATTPYLVSLPFDPKLDKPLSATTQQPCCCLLLYTSVTPAAFYQFGKCCQGAGGPSSHTKSLHWSYDFLVPIGTPILAVQDGVVVAAVDEFEGGAAENKYKARANYVVLRHDSDGLYSRYYHLQPHSLAITRGDRVRAGDLLGNSGSTGYSSGPHLHFDVVDVCIYSLVRVVVFDKGVSKGVDDSVDTGTDTAMVSPTLTTVPSLPASSGTAIVPVTTATTATTTATIATTTATQLYSCIAQFSGPLPPCTSTLRGQLQWANPLDASVTPLINADAVQGKIAVVVRCGKTDFIDKAARAEDAGAVGVIIVNTNDGPELHVCATPKGATRVLRIPVVMVTKKDGLLLTNGSDVSIGLTKDSTLKSYLSSPLRKDWRKMNEEKEFSEYQAVTVGPVAFRIHLHEDDQNASGKKTEQKNNENVFVWIDPKVNESAKNNATLM
jgi:hypothetical protein